MVLQARAGLCRLVVRRKLPAGQTLVDLPVAAPVRAALEAVAVADRRGGSRQGR